VGNSALTRLASIVLAAAVGLLSVAGALASSPQVVLGKKNVFPYSQGWGRFVHAPRGARRIAPWRPARPIVRVGRMEEHLCSVIDCVYFATGTILANRASRSQDRLR
jgi:hypothetical protein